MVKKRAIGRMAGLASAVTVRIGDFDDGRVRSTSHAGRAYAYPQGRWRGLRYTTSGGRPRPDVPDDIVADRVRTALGPVEKDLDLPRLHVMVENHVVTLHGDVATLRELRRIVRAAGAVSGVYDVRSRLHVGLLPSDTRPSAARASSSHSLALRSLIEAAGRGERTEADTPPGG
jgi:hypothetical protein